MDHARIMHIHNFARTVQAKRFLGRAFMAHELAELAACMAADFLKEKEQYAATPKLLIEMSAARREICEALEFEYPAGNKPLAELITALVARCREIIEGRELLRTKITRDTEAHEKEKQQLRVQIATFKQMAEGADEVINLLRANLREMTEMKEAYGKSVDTERQKNLELQKRLDEALLIIDGYDEVASNLKSVAIQLKQELEANRKFGLSMAERIHQQSDLLSKKAEKKDAIPF